MCVQFFTKEGFKKTAEKICDHERTIIKILALLLGFYASTLMRRWWGQVSKLPRLNDVAMVMNAIFQPGIDYAKLWYYWLLSIQERDTKLHIFLAKSQYPHRKLLYFVN